MKIALRSVILLAFIVISLLLSIPSRAAGNVYCPIDGSISFYTGKTKTDVSGKLLELYRCSIYRHEFWVVAN